MTWRIDYLPHVVDEDIPALPKAMRQRIKKAIEQRLTTAPEMYGKPLRFNFSGLRRIRVGDWRVIYCMDPGSHTVTITAIDHCMSDKRVRGLES